MHQAKILAEQGFNQKQVAEKLGVTDRTIRNYLSGNSPSSKNRKQRKSKLDPFKPYIDSILNAELNFNAAVIYKKIKMQGYTGKQTILRDYVRSFKDKQQKEIVRRFETEPGYQAQMDWKELPREHWKGIYAFVMLLGYSRTPFVYFTKDMRSATLLKCQEMAFQHFGGVPQTVLYDNMKTAWIYKDGDWEVNKRLYEMSLIYGFEPKRCRVRRPQTKGKVERFIDFMERNFLSESKLDHLETVKDLNAAVTAWLEEVGELHLRDFEETRNERFELEKDFLSALPEPNAFDSRDIYPVKVSRESLISFQSNKYSVPPKFVSKMLNLRHDPINMVAELFYEGESIKTINLFSEGAKETYFYENDRKAILAMWEEQNKPKTSQKVPTIEAQDVKVRNPSYYDSFTSEVAV